MAEFAVGGFEISQLLGFGATGEVFLARDVRTGELVVLKRLRPEAMAVVERLRREAALVAAVGGAHVVMTRDVLVTAAEVILVMDYASEGSLAELLGRRGRLAPGEAVTVLAPIASVLGRLHGQGALHGDLVPANVLIAADGRPLLADVGLAVAMDTELTAIDGSADYLDPAVVMGARPSPPSDVYSLGAVGFAALAGRPPRIGNDRLARFCPDAPPALIAAIESAIDEDVTARPDAAGFGDALITACPAVPIRLTQPPPPPPGARREQITPPQRAGRFNITAPTAAAGRPARRTTPASRPRPATARPRQASSRRARPRRTRRRLPRVARLAVAGIFAFGLAVVGGLGWGRLHHPPPPEPHRSAPSASRADFLSTSPLPSPVTSVAAWRGIVGYLEATRAQAFATGQPALLRGVYVPGAPGLAVDQASVRSLVRRGLRAAGFTATVDRITVESATPGAATLQVVDRLAGYRLVDSAGNRVGTGAGRPPRAFTMRLVKTPVGWRIATVVP